MIYNVALGGWHAYNGDYQDTAVLVFPNNAE